MKTFDCRNYSKVVKEPAFKVIFVLKISPSEKAGGVVP